MTRGRSQEELTSTLSVYNEGLAERSCDGEVGGRLLGENKGTGDGGGEAEGGGALAELPQTPLLS